MKLLGVFHLFCVNGNSEVRVSAILFDSSNHRVWLFGCKRSKKDDFFVGAVLSPLAKRSLPIISLR